MPIPQEKITLVGRAGEPVPSIDERIFARGLLIADPYYSRKAVED
ncbi:hypothetical protein QUB16_19750 [Microcoleus sp. D3_18a_C4]